MKQVLLATLLFIISVGANAQSTNYRAQGNYYSAKSAYQAGNYAQALDYVYKCKTTLGGTNHQLQYLHVMAAYRLKKYEESKKELEVFFNLNDKKLQPVRFDASVEELTSDETKDLTKLIDPIYEAVDQLKSNPCSKCSGSGHMHETEDCSKCRNGVVTVNCDRCGGYAKERCTNQHGTVDGGCYNGWIPFSSSLGNYTIRCSWCNKGQPNTKPGYSVWCNSCYATGYKDAKCTECNGVGSYEGSSLTTCDRCNGHGFVK